MLDFVTPALNLNLIDGQDRPAQGGETIAVIDPADGQGFTAIPRGTAGDVDAAVAAARRAYEGPYGRMTATERGRILTRLAQMVEAQKDELAAMECRDTGKPLPQAYGDITATARYFEFYGGAADKLHGEVIPYTAGSTVMAVRVPHGVTGHIIPWNYPSQIFSRSVGGALAAGNACVVKPAEDASLLPLRLARMLLECGLPEGALNVVCGLGSEAGAALAGHRGLNHISFTGSPQTGTAVTKAAADNNVATTLELGGKSPQILFADADLEAALPVVVAAIIQNGGQTCAAGSRVLIEASIYDRVMAGLAERFAALVTGAGMTSPDCGPLISRKQLGRVTAMMEQAEQAGVRVASRARVSAEAPEGGFYFPPTLLENVASDGIAGQQEFFGPILAAIPFADEDEAIRIANGTEYGLTAAVWTRDGARQLRVAHRIEAGQVFVNNYGAGGGIELPFGGMKRSGYGREKGFEGLKSFTTIKTIAIRHG